MSGQKSRSLTGQREWMGYTLVSFVGTDLDRKCERMCPEWAAVGSVGGRVSKL